MLLVRSVAGLRKAEKLHLWALLTSLPESPIGMIWPSSSWLNRAGTGSRGVANGTRCPRLERPDRPLPATNAAGADHLERGARPVAGRVLEVRVGDDGMTSRSPPPCGHEAPDGFTVFQMGGTGDAQSVRPANCDQGLRRGADRSI